MKYLGRSLLLLLALALTTVAAVHAEEDLRTLILTDTDGGTIRISELLEGHSYAVLGYWSVGCNDGGLLPTVLAESLQLPGAPIAAALVDTADSPEAVVAGLKAMVGIDPADSYPVVCEDGGLSARFGSLEPPIYLFIDRAGNAYTIEADMIESSEDISVILEILAGEYGSGEATALPVADAPDPVEFASAANGETQAAISWSFGDPELAYPWYVGRRADTEVPCVICGNTGIPSSYSVAVASFEVPEDAVFAFDVSIDSDPVLDVLSITLDGAYVHTLSGCMDRETCAIPVEAGSHEVVFCYIKDELVDDSEDTATLEQVRVLTGSEAEQALNGMAAYPVKGEGMQLSLTPVDEKLTAIELLSGDEPIRVMGDTILDGAYIVPSMSTEIAITAGAEIDPYGSYCYSSYDYEPHLLSTLVRDENGYRMTCAVDSTDTTGVYATQLALIGIGTEGEADHMLLLFASEADVRTFLDSGELSELTDRPGWRRIG